MLPTTQENVEICHVADLLFSAETNKTIGSDGIPPLLPYISRPLTTIFSESFRNASVPSVLKIADVCPIP